MASSLLGFDIMAAALYFDLKKNQVILKLWLYDFMINKR